MRRRVVVIDDQIEILEMMQAILSHRGYEVMVCSEGLRAFDVVKHAHPEVILLDIHMPDLNGWMVLDQLRGDPETAQIPVIISTAAIREVQQEQDRLRRCQCHVLLRPFEFDVLLETLNRAVGKNPSALPD